MEDAKTSDKPAITTSPESPCLTAEELEKKLQEVEDRRKSLEAATLERLAEAEKRAEEVTQTFGNKQNVFMSGEREEGHDARDS